MMTIPPLTRLKISLTQVKVDMKLVCNGWSSTRCTCPSIQIFYLFSYILLDVIVTYVLCVAMTEKFVYDML